MSDGKNLRLDRETLERQIGEMWSAIADHPDPTGEASREAQIVEQRLRRQLENQERLDELAPAMLDALEECDRAFLHWQVGTVPGRPEDIARLLHIVRELVQEGQQLKDYPFYRDFQKKKALMAVMPAMLDALRFIDETDGGDFAPEDTFGQAYTAYKERARQALDQYEQAMGLKVAEAPASRGRDELHHGMQGYDCGEDDEDGQ